MNKEFEDFKQKKIEILCFFPNKLVG